MRHEVKGVLYTTVRENGPSWSLLQVLGETRGQPLKSAIPRIQGILHLAEEAYLAAYEGGQSASEIIGAKV